jgi:hypothetical protein
MQPIGQDATAKRRTTAFGGESHEVASLPGLEPGTYCLEGSCSVQLSYRDGLAVQLPELRTIHPKKISRPTQPTRDFFVFIVTPPSCLNKFTALTMSVFYDYDTG